MSSLRVFPNGTAKVAIFLERTNFFHNFVKNNRSVVIFRSKAPLRLGLAGGGSDVPPFCDMFGGLVLNATITLSAYCTIEPSESGRVVINAIDCSLKESWPVSAALPEECGANLVKGVWNSIFSSPEAPALPKGVKITTWNEAPAGSGLGTSSTMVVCILKCFSEWLGIEMSPYELAERAYRIERIDLGLAGGKQDQWAAAFGGFNFMEFFPDGGVRVNPVNIRPRVVEALESSLLLYYTGRSRSSAEIISRQQKNTASGNETAIAAMQRIKQSSMDMKKALEGGDLKAFSEILGRAWEDKKKMAEGITNPVIQEAFDTATAAGAVSGKVSGAGGGGFLMLSVPPEKKQALKKAMDALPGSVIPFGFTREGACSWREEGGIVIG